MNKTCVGCWYPCLEIVVDAGSDLLCLSHERLMQVDINGTTPGREMSILWWCTYLHLLCIYLMPVCGAVIWKECRKKDFSKISFRNATNLTRSNRLSLYSCQLEVSYKLDGHDDEYVCFTKN